MVTNCSFIQETFSKKLPISLFFLTKLPIIEGFFFQTNSTFFIQFLCNLGQFLTP